MHDVIPTAVSPESPVERVTVTGTVAMPCLTTRNTPELPSVTLYITGSNPTTRSKGVWQQLRSKVNSQSTKSLPQLPVPIRIVK